MKNEELMTLRGGYGLNGYCCYCMNCEKSGVMAGVSSHQECDDACGPSCEGHWYC